MATATLSPAKTKAATKVKEHIQEIEVMYEDGDTFFAKKKESEVAAFRQGVERMDARIIEIICHEKCWCQK